MRHSLQRASGVTLKLKRAYWLHLWLPGASSHYALEPHSCDGLDDLSLFRPLQRQEPAAAPVAVMKRREADDRAPADGNPYEAASQGWNTTLTRRG